MQFIMKSWSKVEIIHICKSALAAFSWCTFFNLNKIHFLKNILFQDLVQCRGVLSVNVVSIIREAAAECCEHCFSWNIFKIVVSAPVTLSGLLDWWLNLNLLLLFKYCRKLKYILLSTWSETFNFKFLS